ncbi:MAG: PEP-CTERM sorting domain-containing protein [Pseudomonadota bacterium]|jgi:hypothetical protein
MERLIASLACAFALFAGASHAATVTPLSYVATPAEGQAQGGSFNYFDDGGRQLIDGIFGGNNWQSDLGNGPAQEWVGWLIANPVITFDFGSQVSITGMILGMNRDSSAGIHIDLAGNANGQLFSIGPNDLPDDTRGDLSVTFAQALVGSSVIVSLVDTRQSGAWLFLDEIQFVGTSSTAVVPVPGALALMLPGLALIGLVARRRRAPAGA